VLYYTPLTHISQLASELNQKRVLTIICGYLIIGVWDYVPTKNCHHLDTCSVEAGKSGAENLQTDPVICSAQTP